MTRSKRGSTARFLPASIAAPARTCSRVRSAWRTSRTCATSRLRFQPGASRGPLMGAQAPSDGFDVVTPLATLLRAPRPHFAWTSLGSDLKYALTCRVEVYDESRNLVLQSPELHELAWTADRDLRRGHEYVW